VDTHYLKISATPLVALHLFDSSSNSTISEIANLLIIFSTSDYINLDLYFSKTKAKVLAPHHSYNLKINLEESVQLPVGLIYSLSVSKQEALKEFI